MTKSEVVERYIEILRLEANGLKPFEIVNDISKNYQISKRTVQRYLNEKQIWQPKITELSNSLLRVINRHEELYRKAMVLYLKVGGQLNPDPNVPSRTQTRQEMIDQAAVLTLLKSLNREFFEMCAACGLIDAKILKLTEESEKLELEWETLAPEQREEILSGFRVLLSHRAKSQLQRLH